jgi:predicted nucleic acid-binding protein
LEKLRQNVRVFLDSSVILSACGSEKSLSRLITILAAERGWCLVSAAYCRGETLKNLNKFETQARAHWQDLEAQVEWTPNALTKRRPILLTASKDKPVLISALAAKCDALLTLDAGDFGIILNTIVYGMHVLTPREFLIQRGLG